MCGRYSLTSPPEAMRRLFGLAATPNLPPRYNIAPTQEAPVVRAGAQGRELHLLRWGLVPAWAEDPALGARLINARSETVADKPSFRRAFRQRRCLVPADGFYEWRKEGTRKQPFRAVLAERGPFAFAGLWERWDRAAAGGPLESFTILTTEANALLRPIHARMPVIVAPHDYAAWLDPTRAANDALALLKPCASEAMAVYPVSLRVNSPRHDDPECIEPLDSIH